MKAEDFYNRLVSIDEDKWLGIIYLGVHDMVSVVCNAYSLDLPNDEDIEKDLDRIYKGILRTLPKKTRALRRDIDNCILNYE